MRVASTVHPAFAGSAAMVGLQAEAARMPLIRRVASWASTKPDILTEPKPRESSWPSYALRPFGHQPPCSMPFAIAHSSAARSAPVRPPGASFARNATLAAISKVRPSGKRMSTRNPPARCISNRTLRFTCAFYVGPSHGRPTMDRTAPRSSPLYWELIADEIKREGWSVGWVRAVVGNRLLWSADATKHDGRRFIA